MKLEKAFNDDKKLRAIFSWLTRIGAAHKFGSLPIGWYQQHQCACIEYLTFVRGCQNKELRCRKGIIESQCPDGTWIAEISATALYSKADNFCRTHELPLQ
jgi:hypothetical protein